MLTLPAKLTNVMKHIRRPWVWLARVRKRRGYGVHSPFAYGFLRGVLLETSPYYAYSRLAQLHPWYQRHLLTYPMHCRRMLFRLANAVQPHTYRLVGELPLERSYVAAAVPSAREVSEGAAGLLVVSADEAQQALTLVPQMSPSDAMVVEGIHRNRRNRNLWRALRSDDRTGISFDLYDYGILFFDRSRTKQNYIVNF